MKTPRIALEDIEAYIATVQEQMAHSPFLPARSLARDLRRLFDTQPRFQDNAMGQAEALRWLLIDILVENELSDDQKGLLALQYTARHVLRPWEEVRFPETLTNLLYTLRDVTSKLQTEAAVACLDQVTNFLAAYGQEHAEAAK